ncbi:MAG: hypothetical protein ACK5WZ_06765 [Pseudobdellovibrionaceae bacterium]
MKMNFIVPAALLMFNTFVYAQSVSDCKHKIHFLPQTHPTVLGRSLQMFPENADKTARSQFAIAKYLERHKDMPVFSEQISTDQTVQTVSPEFKKVAAQIKSMFPNGLPQNFDNLAEDQKNIIALAGGDAISFILRNTNMLHRVVENDQIQDQLIGKVSSWTQANPNARTPPPDIVNTIFNVREKLALDQINNYIKAYPSKTDIILIYGSDHSYSFKTHPDKFPPQCILIPNEFLSAVTSPYNQYSSGSGYGSYGNSGQPSGAAR